MDFAADEEDAILSKCFTLIDKTEAKLQQLDTLQFPTESSETALQLLKDVLEAVKSPANVAPMNPPVLYKFLLSAQHHLHTIEQSSTEQISWPLVRYCDAIWEKFFGTDGPQIFYSVTPAHNYSIRRFSAVLEHQLQGVLPKVQIEKLIDQRDVYLLQLASIEDYNLPLYAIIGHEFGHAVYNDHESELLTVLSTHFAALLPIIYTELQHADPTQANRRFRRTVAAICGVANELFSDLVGAVLMGPAFLLSLYEMSWGQEKDAWTVSLSPNADEIIAYPSFSFRLHCINRAADTDGFCDDAKREFSKLEDTLLVSLAECLKTIPLDHIGDKINVLPSTDGDAQKIGDVLNSHLDAIKTGLEAFLVDSEILVRQWCNMPEPSVSAQDVADLLLRLHHKILPNVTPDGTRLGRRATFAAILNASALFRLHLLVNEIDADPKELFRETGIVERLTAKAFEVSFIQREFENWRLQADGSSERS
jgi:hypothetical protein